MGCISIIGACISAIGIDYAELPTTTNSYSEDRTWDVSKFYDQKIPNFRASGHYALNNNDAILFSLDTGIHTEKLNTASIGIDYKKAVKLSDNWTLVGSTGIDYNYTKHKPCADSENRQYYCGNLTAWSDFEGNNNEIIHKIGINFNYRW